MKLLRYFRKHGSAEHRLFESIYRLHGYLYRDRSCLPPVIAAPSGRQLTEAECWTAITTTTQPPHE